MSKSIIFFLVLLLNCSQDKSTKNMDSENFFIFFRDFCSNADFQKSRIKFPLKSVYLSDNLNDTVEEILEESDWNFYKIKDFKTNTVEYYFNSFDDKKIPESDQKVFSIFGIENGILLNYYFERLDGKWYMVKVEDLST